VALLSEHVCDLCPKSPIRQDHAHLIELGDSLALSPPAGEAFSVPFRPVMEFPEESCDE